MHSAFNRRAHYCTHYASACLRIPPANRNRRGVVSIGGRDRNSANNQHGISIINSVRGVSA